MMSKNPVNLYRFYKDESSFVFANADEASVNATGIENIKARIAELPLDEGVSIDLKDGTVDAQKSENDSVFLLVVGVFHPPSAAPRPFMQTFVLARQMIANSTSASYFVRNSIFRFLAAPKKTPEVVPEPVATHAVTPVHEPQLHAPQSLPQPSPSQHMHVESKAVEPSAPTAAAAAADVKRTVAAAAEPVEENSTWSHQQAENVATDDDQAELERAEAQHAEVR